MCKNIFQNASFDTVQKNYNDSYNNRFIAMKNHKNYYSKRIIVFLLYEYLSTVFLISACFLMLRLIHCFITPYYIVFLTLLTAYYFGGFLFLFRKYNSGPNNDIIDSEIVFSKKRTGLLGKPYFFSRDYLFCSIGKCRIDRIKRVKIEQKRLIPNPVLDIVFRIVDFLSVTWKESNSPNSYILVKVFEENEISGEYFERLIILNDVKKEYCDLINRLNDSVTVDSLSMLY